MHVHTCCRVQVGGWRSARHTCSAETPSAILTMSIPTTYLLGRDPLGTVGAQQPAQDTRARRPTARCRHRRCRLRTSRASRSSSRGHCCCSLRARLRFCLDQLAQLGEPGKQAIVNINSKYGLGQFAQLGAPMCCVRACRRRVRACVSKVSRSISCLRVSSAALVVTAIAASTCHSSRRAVPLASGAAVRLPLLRSVGAAALHPPCV